MALRTYAPVGETPTLHETLTRDHLSVMAGITPEGKLYQRTQEHAFNGDGVVGYLEHLLRQIGGKVVVVWDGAPIHRSEAVKAFLATRTAERLHLEALPGYAPDLNPTDGLWSYLKRVELGNVCCHDLSELRIELRKAIERIRQKPAVIQSCFRQAGLC